MYSRGRVWVGGKNARVVVETRSRRGKLQTEWTEAGERQGEAQASGDAEGWTGAGDDAGWKGRAESPEETVPYASRAASCLQLAEKNEN